MPAGCGSREFGGKDRALGQNTVDSAEGAVSRSLVLIGEEAWFRSGDGRWKEVSPDDPSVTNLLKVAFSPIREDFLGGPDYQQVRDMAAVQTTVGFKGPKVVSMPTEQDRRNAIADMAMHNNVSMSQETINRLARIKE